jgi:two-component system, chemotaxis family, chemotaxis protein CheY
VAEKLILVVEDNAIQREGMVVVLGQHGYTVLPAADGKTALDLLRNGPIPDLIMLDMMIPPPDCDGWHFLEKLKQIPAAASVPVLITTSLSIASKEWAASLGACCLVRKPVDTDLLLVTIRRCLAGCP